MELQLLLDNLTNPALLFFFLGLLAVQVKSDLEIPGTSSKFISLYLLFSIGFKGGQELSHSNLDMEILWSLLFGVFMALIVPVYSFFLLKRKLGVWNAGAIAAAYGSVSAVTFVTAVSFLEMEQIEFGGHMVAVMALMEAPSIIV
ncbi:MAG TPA: sodium-dependent bicarbonate transport family permease, partial [Roseivirga sp.]